MRSIFDKFSDAYVKYYSTTTHLSPVEVTVLFEGRVFMKHAREIQTAGDKSLQAL